MAERLLVVEDEVKLAGLLRDYLAQEGYEVSVLHRGDQVEDWMREHGVRAASSGEACQSCHREQFCASCHGKSVAALPSTLSFANPFTPSVHRAGFASRHSLEAKSEPGACATCHQPDRCIAPTPC